MAHPSSYLIIGGSTKCGTTSVFKYLEFHPQICACRMKESRYFLEADYKMQATGRDHTDTGNFASLFDRCKTGQTGLEATPDYLYSDVAAKRMHQELEQIKLIFILREPVGRLISWYRFARMNGLLGPDVTFDEYVHLQANSSNGNQPQHLKALEQGNYFTYINEYIQVFGESSIHICFYEDLARDPASFCKSIATFAGIDKSYFDKYDFRIFNRSADTRSSTLHTYFRKFKRTIRPATRLLPGNVRKRLKLAGHGLEEAVVRANSTQIPVTPSHQTLAFLEAYYNKDTEDLMKQYKVPVEWQRS